MESFQPNPPKTKTAVALLRRSATSPFRFGFSALSADCTILIYSRFIFLSFHHCPLSLSCISSTHLSIPLFSMYAVIVDLFQTSVFLLILFTLSYLSLLFFTLFFFSSSVWIHTFHCGCVREYNLLHFHSRLHHRGCCDRQDRVQELLSYPQLCLEYLLRCLYPPHSLGL